MKEVLISCTHTQTKLASPTHLTRHRLGLSAPASGYLHGERVRERGNTLQGFIGAAASASPQRNAGRHEEMVRLPRQLLPDLHQRVPGLAAAPGINLQPATHWQRDRDRSVPRTLRGRERDYFRVDVPSRPSLNFGESAGRQ